MFIFRKQSDNFDSCYKFKFSWWSRNEKIIFHFSCLFISYRIKLHFLDVSYIKLYRIISHSLNVSNIKLYRIILHSLNVSTHHSISPHYNHLISFQIVLRNTKRNFVHQYSILAPTFIILNQRHFISFDNNFLIICCFQCRIIFHIKISKPYQDI